MADMRMRATQAGGVTDLKVLMNHPMESGTRRDAKTNELVPAHYITEVLVKVNGTPVATVQWGGGVAKNPYLALQFKGCKVGDTVQVSWVDNTGGSDSCEGKIS